MVNHPLPPQQGENKGKLFKRRIAGTFNCNSKIVQINLSLSSEANIHKETIDLIPFFEKDDKPQLARIIQVEACLIIL